MVSHSQLVAQAAPEGAVRAVRGPPGGTRGMAAVRRDCVRSQGGRAVVGKNPDPAGGVLRQAHLVFLTREVFASPTGTLRFEAYFQISRHYFGGAAAETFVGKRAPFCFNQKTNGSRAER